MLAPGTLLQNRYRVIRLLSEGGMGAVYEALDVRLDSIVALKETLRSSPELSQQFEREAQMLARLRHPGIPRVMDHFVDEAGQFLVMEYISGEDLGQMLKDRGRPFPWRDVLGWGEQILDALGYLHGQSPPVIHRDIKPANMKFCSPEQIILLDFGLAKGFASSSAATAAGSSIFGYTPHYAPLEQINGEGTTPRTDIYSLAATLYHLMTNEKPPDALGRVAASINGKPDPLKPAIEVNREIPVAVSDLLIRAMSQASDVRPESAKDFKTLLRQAAAAPPEVPLAVVGLSAAPPPASSSPPAVVAGMEHAAAPASPAREVIPEKDKKRKSPFLLLVLILFLLILALGWWIKSKRTSPPEIAAPFAPLAESEVTSTSSTEPPGGSAAAAPLKFGEQGKSIRTVDFSPDGKLLAVAWEEGLVKVWDLASKSVRSTVTAPGYTITSAVFSPDDGKRLAVSGYGPDGSRVFFADPQTGKTIPGSPVLIERGNLVGRVLFSPDGAFLVAPMGAIRVWDTRTGKEKFNVESVTNSVLAVSPDGKLLAVAGSNDNDVRLWSLEDGTSEGNLLGHTKGLLSLAFFPGSRLLASGSYDSTVAIWDVAARTKLRSMNHGETEAIFSLAVSPGGDLVASGSYHDVKVWRAADGGYVETFREAPNGGGIYSSLAFSRDGRTLAAGSSDGFVRLWTVGEAARTGSAGMTKLPKTLGGVQALAFSPDGKRLATGSWDGNACTWTTASATMEHCLNTRNSVTAARFSPNGNEVAFGMHDTHGSSRILFLDAASGHEKGDAIPLTDPDAHISGLSYSPDGTLLIGIIGKRTLVWNASNHQMVRSMTLGDNEFMATSTSGAIAAASQIGGDVRFGDWRNGEAKGKLEAHQYGLLSLAYSPDGGKLVTGGRDAAVRLWNLATGKKIWEYSAGSAEQPKSLAWAPDATTIAVGTRKVVRLLSSADGSVQRTLPIDEYSADVMTYSPDGSALAIGGDGAVFLVALR
ncbi:MAG: protein kinase [Acidobacteriota bacterium]